MKQINLIPPEIKQNQLARRAGGASIVAGIVACGIVGFSWFVVSKIATSIASEGSHSTLATQAADPQTGSVTPEGMRQRDDLIKRTLALNTLAATEINWDKVFTIINSIIPPDIILKTSVTTVVSDGVTASLTGSAASNLSFAAFAESLKQDTRLSKIVISTFSFDPIKAQVAFSLTISLPSSQVAYQKLPVVKGGAK